MPSEEELAKKVKELAKKEKELAKRRPWEAMKISNQDALSWEKANFTSDEVSKWKDAGAEEFSAIRWRREGVTPNILKKWKKAGYSDGDIRRFIRDGTTLQAIDNKAKKAQDEINAKKVQDEINEKKAQDEKNAKKAQYEKNAKIKKGKQYTCTDGYDEYTLKYNGYYITLGGVNFTDGILGYEDAFGKPRVSIDRVKGKVFFDGNTLTCKPRKKRY